MLRLRGLLVLTFIAELHAVPLLISCTKSVKLVEHSDTSNVTDLSATTTVIALDYHYRRGEFYFSDALGTLRRGWLRGPNLNSKSVVIAELKLCDGLAVDWVHDNLYWTDITRRTLEMSDLDGLHRRILFNSSDGLEKPRAVALDPYQGLVFWSDWGSNGRVESSGLDGKKKKIIVTSDLVWPNGLTLDLDSKKLFIMDGMRSSISSCNYDGSGLSTIFQNEGMLKQAFGLSYYDDKLFWDSWRTHAVYSLDISSGQTETVLKRTGWRLLTERMMGMKAIHDSLQKPATSPDPCATAGCSHLCLLGPGPSASCVCRYGFTLQDDGKSCLEEGYLIISWRGTVRRYTLHGGQEEPMYDSSKAAIALDYHYNKGLVFWSDIDEKRIYRAHLGQFNNKSVVAVTETCDGLAVDWVHDVLYWTDTEHNTLEASQLDGSDRKIIISQDLDQPRAIVLDPHSGFMFWSDWGHKAKIERAWLDGSDRTTILSDSIFWPNGITLDLDQKKIYWVDGQTSSISTSSYDGTRRELVLGQSPVSIQPFAISMYQDAIYWTDWKTMALYKANKTDMAVAIKLAEVSIILLRPNGIKVVHSSLQRAANNPCSLLKCHGLCVGSQIPPKAHCLGELIETDEVTTPAERNYIPEVVGIIKKTFNDSFQLSTNSSTSLSIVLVSVKCVKRLGCKEDKKCSSFTERTESFTNQSQFTITGLLPATEYELTFVSPEHKDKFTLRTLTSDPPEIPNQLSAEVKGTTVAVKWDPVDECIPDFRYYNYKLHKGKMDEDGETDSEPMEGHTNTTEVTFEKLRPETVYTFLVYTNDQNHFSSVEFSTNEAEKAIVMEDLIVYKKSRSEVFFRAVIRSSTRAEVEKFGGTYKSSDSDRSLTFERKALPCVMWPESFCFNVSSLEPNKTYDFSVSATLKNGTVCQERNASAITKEEVPGPPEDLHVASFTTTSVELHWSHPNQSQGIIRSFLVNIDEVETTEADKCCQSFPILELPVKTEEATFQVETAGLLPASTYAISVTAKTLYVGGSRSVDVHTPPPPMDILKIPNIVVASQLPLQWDPRSDSPSDMPQYHQLIRSYILLLLPTKNGERKDSSTSNLGELQSLLESKFGKDLRVIAKRTKDALDDSLQPLVVAGLVPGQQYRLAWVQVSEYKSVFGLDYIMTQPFVAQT